jgi:hypothetical protein
MRLLRGEGDPRGRSAVLVTALGSWEKPVPRGHVPDNVVWFLLVYRLLVRRAPATIFHFPILV